MFWKSLKSISIMFKHAPGLTIVKLTQVLVSAALAPLSIYFTQRLIDAATNYAVNGPRGLILWGGLLLVSLLLSSIGGGFLNGILYIAMRRALNSGMTSVFAEKFKRLDYACFEDRAVRDTLERMSSDPQEKLFQLFLTMLGVTECIIGVIGAALIFAQAGLVFVAGFALLLVPMVWLDFKAVDMANAIVESQAEDERMMRYLGGLLSDKSSLFELKLFRAVGYIAGKWRRLSRDVLAMRLKTTIRAHKLYLVVTILFKAWSFFVILALVAAAVSQSLTIGLFTALIASTGAVLDNTTLLSRAMQDLRMRYLVMEHYYKFMALPEIQPGGKALTGGAPHIVFDKLSFAYPGTSEIVLNCVSFELKPGERAALVGENGAGKSTIIKLLCRLYKPSGGRILINGQDIQELDARELRKVFSVVFQDFCKYELTLRENVAFGDISKLGDNASLNAALKTGLAAGIAALDTPLGKLEECGVDLSGGEWQRIAVARACLPESAFVILDEPTAALDPLAESEMYHSFAEVLKNRGCIMISHRLASAKMVDKIIVLSGGTVAEAGSHSELMTAGGLYARMYESQSAWYTGGAGQ